ncbi:hypothetical protein BC628DRAFT_1423425 [Trametes gibbosa]|nr:hypothetical protein BC628DRAFT_1423425 [Trametes gibbosa]
MSIAALAQLPADSFDGELIPALDLVEKTQGLVSAVVDEGISGDAVHGKEKAALSQDADRAVTFFVSLDSGDHDVASPKVHGDHVEQLCKNAQTPTVDLAVEIASVQGSDSPSGNGSDTQSLHSPVSLECPPGLNVPPPSVTITSEACAAGNSTSPSEDPTHAMDTAVSQGCLDDIFAIDPTVFQDAWHAYSLTRLERLQTFIPDPLLPDDLLIHDPDNLTNASIRGGSKPIRYVRVYPIVTRSGRTPGPNAYASRQPEDVVHTADLFLRKGNCMGEGHHSEVFRAPLTLRLDSGSEARSRVSVAVKVASNHCGAHEMLRQEAKMYNAFPHHIMEDRACSSDHTTHGGASCADARASGPSACDGKSLGGEKGCAAKSNAAASDIPAPSPPPPPPPCSSVSVQKKPVEVPGQPVLLPAIVPKFFGYYSPVNEDGTLNNDLLKHFEYRNSDDTEDERCRVDWPTSVLLLEECGRPVYQHRNDLCRVSRNGCYKLFERLHEAGFIQNSTYERNIVVQPGPLSVPRKERSLRTPSFRIIDFGRGRRSTPYSGNDVRYERSKAKRELHLD